MPATPHQLRRVVADPTGTTVAVVVEQTVYTYDGENAAAILAETDAHLENSLRGTGRAWSELPANAQAPAPGAPFPKKGKP